MKCRKLFVVSLILLAFLTACGKTNDVCEPGSVTYADGDDPIFAASAKGEPAAAPSEVKIGSKTIQMEQVIVGPLCNADLKGTVYVACNIQVKKWVDAPNFLVGCDFNVAPGTVIYVAAHNNGAYYNGCASCHASAEKQP